MKQEEYYSAQDIGNKIKAFIGYLMSKWVWLSLCVVVSSGLGWGYYYSQNPKYVGISSFILEEKSGGGASGLAGLASQFGFDVGGLNGGGSIFAGDNILDIIKSRLVVEKVLLTKIKKEDSSTISLADLYLTFNGYKKRWSNNKKLSELTFNTVNERKDLSRLQDSVLYLIYKGFVGKYLSVDRTSKKGSIFNVQVTSINQEFSKYAVERLVAESRNLYINIKTSTSQANIARLEFKADSLLQILNSKSYQTAQMQVLDANPAIKTAFVPIELSQRDKQVVATIYTEVVKNLEAGKISLSQQTPVIQLLDTPSFPLEDNKKGKLSCVAFALLLGLVFSSVYFLLRFFLTSVRSPII